MSTVSLMEIEYGLALNPSVRQKFEKKIRQVLNYIDVLPFTEDCALTTAAIRADLKKKGNLIGPYDLMIAGSAQAYGLTISTDNTHEFERVSGLDLVNWCR